MKKELAVLTLFMCCNYKNNATLMSLRQSNQNAQVRKVESFQKQVKPRAFKQIALRLYQFDFFDKFLMTLYIDKASRQLSFFFQNRARMNHYKEHCMTNSCCYAEGTDRVDLFHLFVKGMSSILDTDGLLS